ncbi:MAG TPA: hypothetical protein VH968_12710 [Gaiellaceae bacterium]|jgi:hypothetical protein
MLRTLTLVSILCGLAVTGWMFTRNQLQTTEAAPAAILQAAATAMEFSHRANGTYAGAAPDGVTLVWADQFRYCIEATGWFVSGPGGVPAQGSCPR